MIDLPTSRKYPWNRLQTWTGLHWLDRLPLLLVAVAGAMLGGAIGGAGFFYLQAPGWVIFWLALFVALGWLGYSASPVFEEDNPVPLPARPRRVRDGPLAMMELLGGTFLMGSPDSDDMARDNEKPQHEVTVSSFRMAVVPVTVELYREIMPESSASESEAKVRWPVTDVSWHDAIEFCNRLSKRAGYRPCYARRSGRWRCDWRADGYRLPTEAEWEYACRAGTTSRYCFGDDPTQLDAYAWYKGNTSTVQPVATRRPNPWGLYDMHGHVWEWCWDSSYGAYSSKPFRNPHGPRKSKTGRRVVRGGSFFFSPEGLRSAFRVGYDPERRFWYGIGGFRCVRVPPPPVD